MNKEIELFIENILLIVLIWCLKMVDISSHVLLRLPKRPYAVTNADVLRVGNLLTFVTGKWEGMWWMAFLVQSSESRLSQQVIPMKTSNSMKYNIRHIIFNRSPRFKYFCMMFSVILCKWIRLVGVLRVKIWPSEVCSMQSVGVLGYLQIIGVFNKILFDMFETLIHPILLYGSDVWGIRRQGNDMVNKVFYCFIRCVLGVKATTSNLMMLGESGQMPPSVFSLINTIYYIKRLHHLPSRMIVRQMYTEMSRLHECGFVTWVTIAQIAPLSFQTSIPHKPRQVCWGELHAPVVTEWSPTCLHKELTRGHHTGN